MSLVAQSRGRRQQRGLSLVELMVGVAVGLFIVAGATMLAASQLAGNRNLLLETQVQQDLRAAADIITRELRRAGYRPKAELHIWSSAATATEPQPNLRAGLRTPTTDPQAASGDEVSYNYERVYGENKDFGYRFSVSDGVIKHRIDNVSQDLTDRNTLKITNFKVELQDVASEQLACPRLCTGNSQACWPTVKVVDAIVTITGEAANNADMKRTVVSRVRLRNDGVKFSDNANPVCPS